MSGSARPVSSLRVGLASAEDPTSAGYSSGTPRSLWRALGEVVGEAVPVGGELPPRLKRLAVTAGQLQGIRSLSTARSDMRAAQARARLRLPLTAARSAAVGVRMLRRHPIDLCVQHGAEYVVPLPVPYVTFEDSTFAQAYRAYPWPHLEGITHRDLHSLQRRQRRLYRRAAACCTMSHWAAQSIIADYAIDAEQVHVVGVGPNHTFERPATRAWWPPRFLFVGMDWTRKNGARVVEAFQAVRKSHPSATLDVVGRHPKLGHENVREHGVLSLDTPAERDSLGGLFQRATVLVAPSLHDPSPVVHVEAGTAGIGSIGTRNGGAATLVGTGGILVDPLDQEALTRGMLAMCDPVIAREAGENAYELSRELTWRKVAERLVRAGRLDNLDESQLAGFL